MNVIRISTLLALTGLLAVACSKQDDVATAAANPLLAYVPADTPYVFANLEPTPSDIVDAWLARLEPALVQAQSKLDELQADLQAGHAEMDESFAAVAAAVLGELDGKLNRSGMESLGISLESLNAIYGYGLFPVARIGLGDAQAMRDTIDRIETRSGTEIPEFQSGGLSYWKIEDGDHGIAAFIAILDDHVAFGVAPVAAEAAYLPVLLGVEAPAESVADTGILARLNREQGFEPWGSGYLDVKKVVEELLVPDSRTATWLNALGEYRPGDISGVCANEARLVASYVPRMLGGVTEMTTDTLGMRYLLEFEPRLAAELADLVADVPPASADTSYAMAMSLGIRVGALREFLLEKANAMAANPFQCPRLEDFNSRIQQAAVDLNQPMPPFIGNLKGFRAVLEEFDPTHLEPADLLGLFALEVESPQMVIGMANMFIPGFEELGIQPGDEPVQLPQELATVVTPDIEMYAAMSSDAIGLSLGKGQKDKLAGFMAMDEDNDGVFLSLEYDLTAISELQASHMPAHGELAEIYRDMLDRTRIELRFTETGLVIDNRVSFK